MQSVSEFEAAEDLPPNVYLVKIDGDSMEGAGIFDEDVVIVDKAIDARSGHIVIAAGLALDQRLVRGRTPSAGYER